jgi:hypothetical protein
MAQLMEWEWILLKRYEDLQSLVVSYDAGV